MEKKIRRDTNSQTECIVEVLWHHADVVRLNVTQVSEREEASISMMVVDWSVSADEVDALSSLVPIHPPGDEGKAV